MTGSKRIDTVTVALSSGTVTMPWGSRQELLGYLRLFEDARPVVAAFEAVGASQPVKLTAGEKVSLLRRVEAWADDELGGSYPRFPDGVGTLRDGLHDDLDKRAL